jgi:hypothetical protein
MSEPTQFRFDPAEAVRKAVGDRKNAKNGLPLDPWCPKCGAPECHPTQDHAVLIRGFKVDNWSECLVCSSAVATNGQGYDENLVWHGARPEGGPKDHGWFFSDDSGAMVAVQ